MKFIMNKKFRIIQDFLSAFILTILIIMLLAINTFHDSEHFIDTAILNDMVSEQADMIYEYCIEPNAFNFKLQVSLVSLK